MKKHTLRHTNRKMIRAAAKAEMMQCEAAGVEWIEAEAAEGQSPKPPKFSMVAYTGGPMMVGYYGAPVAIDLAGLTAGDTVPILLDHDRSQIVGHADDIQTSATQLKLAGIVSGVGEAAEQVKATAKNGFPWKASIGAWPDKMEFVGEGVTTKVNGKSLTGPLYVARKSTLREVSFVAVPADGRTSARIAATAAKHGKEQSEMNFEQWVETMGLVLAELRDDQVAKLRTKYDAEVKAAAKHEGTVEGQAKVKEPTFDLSAVVLAYEKHVAAVQAKAAGYAGKIDKAKLDELQAKAGQDAAELKAKALNEEWPAVRLEVELVKAAAQSEIALIQAERPKGPAIHSSTRDVSQSAIEAAFCMAAGLQGVEKAFDAKTLEAAATYQRVEGASLQGLILAAAVANGYTGGARRIHRGNFDQVMRAAFIQAAASTHTLTTLLTTVGNKFLLEGFTTVEQVWREISATRPVNDFKSITSYRMLDDMVFEEVGPDGGIKHGTASQESYTNQAKTYAKMFSLTRQDIINDDLGAFDTIRARIGRGSGIKLNQVFWAAFLDDSAFFTSARANLITNVLGEAGIAAANVALKSMTDGYGNPIDIGGQHIMLTGSTLNPTAKKWYVAQEMRDTTATTKYPTTNIYQNQYRPVESRYITSTITWYLLPVAAGDMAPMEVAFLDGVQSPTIESADADFDTLGVQFRGYFDFGVARKEWRASVKSAGTG